MNTAKNASVESSSFNQEVLENKNIAKLHFILNIVTRSIELYIDGYSSVIDPYAFIKSSYSKLDLRYFRALPDSSDFLEIASELRNQKRLNRRNTYAALGKIIFQLSDKDLALFTELMINRGNLYRASEPIEDEFLFVSESDYSNPKESHLISASADQLTDDELDFISSIYPDLSVQIFKIDRKLCRLFQALITTRDVQIDKDDLFIIEEIEAMLPKKKSKN